MSLWASVRGNVAWKAIPVAGAAAGTVFLILSLVLMPLAFGVNATLVLRYFGSLVLGSQVLVQNDTLTLIVGVIMHYALSALFTLVIALVVHRWGLLVGVIGGGLLGLAIYGINLYLFTRLLGWFEWFYALAGPVLLASHIAFGAVAGGVYELLDHYDVPFNQGGER
ncbi:MAG: hypothetical protein BroJett033_5770 [Chloroflexota bacterium]|nr:MAG: hypothetical protein BroJett033_5770 [Chloroflexota bacterium]